jgi:hypothetical protein
MLDRLQLLSFSKQLNGFIGNLTGCLQGGYAISLIHFLLFEAPHQCLDGAP